MAEPTAFADLNALLRRLVAGVRAALAEGFVGAYLQGSFALGDADEHSDVDFLIVTREQVTDPQLAALQALHRRLHRLNVAWAKHLEGSYVPRHWLRHIDAQRRPLYFLDNGADQLVLDPHCNTAYVRWILRAKGVALVGPSPKRLVAPVAVDQLRQEAALALFDYRDWARTTDETGRMSQWRQPYLVLTFCRILHTLATGTIDSKRRAALWALESLDPAWHSLIARAIADRPDPWGRVHRPADPALVEQTVAFGDYAASRPAVVGARRSLTFLAG